MVADLSSLPQLLSDSYRSVAALKEIAPDRSFTLDGHLVGSIGEVVAAYAHDLKLEKTGKKGFDAIAPDGREVQIKPTQGKRIAISHDCTHLLVLGFDEKVGFVEVYNGSGRPVWSLIGHKAAAGRQRPITVARLRAFSSPPESELKRMRPFPAVLARLVEAGVAFTSGGEPGVKLKRQPE